MNYWKKSLVIYSNYINDIIPRNKNIFITSKYIDIHLYK